MADSDSTQPQKAPPIRALVINLVFSIFVSVVVFSIASFGILVPHMYEQKHQIEALNAKVLELDARLTAATEPTPEPIAAADEAPAEPAAEAPATPAAEPAAAPEGATAAEVP